MSVFQHLDTTFNAIRTDVNFKDEKPLDIMDTLLSDERSNRVLSFAEGAATMKLAFLGALGAGKTTLINTLLGTLLPTGAGFSMSRITILRYAPLADANITMHRISVNGLLPIHEPPIKLADAPNQKEATKLAHKLCRMSKENGASESVDAEYIEEWVQKVVVIRYPFPMLGGGLEVYDIPGFEKDEHPSLSIVRANFFTMLQPHAVVFCYANPAFSDHEVFSYEELRALASLVVKFNLNEHVFFANTKFNVAAIKSNYNMEDINDVTDELLLSEERTIFKQLRQRSLLQTTHDTRFSIVNSMDYLRVVSKQCSKVLFSRFIERLTKWTITVRHARVNFVLDELISLCVTFYSRFMNNKNDMPPPGWDLAEKLQDLLKDIQAYFEDSIKWLPDLFEKQCRAVNDEAMIYAGNTVLEQYDGAYQVNSAKLEAIGAFKAKVAPWFVNHITIPVLDELCKELSTVCYSAINSTNSLYLKELFNEWTLEGVINELKSKLYDSLSKSMRLQHKGIENKKNMLAKVFTDKKPIDILFKMRTMGKILKLFGQSPDTKTLATIANQTFDDYKRNLNVRASVWNLFLNKLRALNARTHFAVLQLNVGRLHVEVMANMFKLNNPFDELAGVSDNIIAYGPSGMTYTGVFGGDPVFIKRCSHLPVISGISQSHLAFFEEAYYTPQLVARSVNLLPLIAVQWNTEHIQLIYKRIGVPLKEFIGSVGTISDMQVLVLWRQIAIAIKGITDYGFSHNDVSVENVFVVVGEQVATTRLGNIGSTLKNQSTRPDLRGYAHILKYISEIVLQSYDSFDNLYNRVDDMTMNIDQIIDELTLRIKKDTTMLPNPNQ
ncbi:hypothetical protein SAMD00019534_114670 [Acytostelium subglobosum LB1]|uniref:hypothetical protein n=1 Tax=Acytostelium subglobosum LB1 TaxID=1410327 RepID=UPI000644AB3C|nr:hypothetical protein SAMD00019534_114670 [Acytostelium subglobosum LB1]GAM28291.1 hypothetical protein SAMD00019534_114670 [Acytostelium subglobosum LB1]|eukprot:XP_012748925.1 hypothetical protein SAMD00019534_114670 [Acytostelium subglobosum LB1]